MESSRSIQPLKAIQRTGSERRMFAEVLREGVHVHHAGAPFPTQQENAEVIAATGQIAAHGHPLVGARIERRSAPRWQEYRRPDPGPSKWLTWDAAFLACSPPRPQRGRSSPPSTLAAFSSVVCDGSTDFSCTIMCLHVGLVSLLERYSGATRPKCEIAAA